MKARAVALAVIALIASTSTPSMAHFNDGPDFDHDRIVVTEAGAVRGTVNPTTVAFLGIPYRSNH